MKNSSAIPKEVESVLSRRITSALTPQMRSETLRLETGVAALDTLTGGGLPMGAITELPMRKPPQPKRMGAWRGQASWAGHRGEGPTALRKKR